MSLVDLWRRSRDQIDGKQLHQIIAFAGEGRLRDGNQTSDEFRELLSEVPSPMLERFVDECLNSGFQDSGLALQDVVNEVGRRLGFQVTNGAYQGRQGQLGHDGVWKLPTGHYVVVEVKTTDAYNINTAKIAMYRKHLVVSGAVPAETSSALLVVGRQDTDGLEEQIRGSRHAWEIRLISVGALLRLMSLKETLDDPRTIGRICGILIPKEYTRLDDMVELVFSAAEDAKEPEVDVGGEPAAAPTKSKKAGAGVGPAGKPAAFHEACVARLDAHEKLSLVKQSRSSWASPDGKARVVCAVSKLHGQYGSYWFAFHPYQEKYLADARTAFLVLGCGDPSRVLAIPYPTFRPWLDDVWTTERSNGERYWHLRVRANGKKLDLDRKKGKGRLDITPYLVPK